MIGVLVIFCAFHNSEREDVCDNFQIQQRTFFLPGDLLGGLLEQEVQGGDALPIRHLPPVLLPHRY